MLRSRRLRIQTFFSRPKKKKKKTFFFQKDDFESVSNQDQFDSIPNDSNDSNSVNSGDESPQSPPHKRACYENHAEQMPLHAGFKAPRSGKYFYYPHGVDGVFFRPVWQVLPQQQRVQQRMHRPAAYAANTPVVFLSSPMPSPPSSAPPSPPSSTQWRGVVQTLPPAAPPQQQQQLDKPSVFVSCATSEAKGSKEVAQLLALELLKVGHGSTAPRAQSGEALKAALLRELATEITRQQTKLLTFI